MPLIKSDYLVPAVVSACATAVGVAIGYRLARATHKPARIDDPNSNKSYLTNNALTIYASEHTVRYTPAQEKLLQVTLDTMGRAARMAGSSDELYMLATIVKALGARKTIDIGCFTGLSALSIAQVLPEGGKVVSCDVSEKYPEVGKPYWREAGVEKKIDLNIRPASETLRKLLENGEAGTYDYAFIDADKTGYDTYYELCLQLIRPGGLIAVDNMAWGGRVCDPSDQSADTVAIRKLNDKIHNDDRVESTLLLIGDGTVLAFKKMN